MSLIQLRPVSYARGFDPDVTTLSPFPSSIFTTIHIMPWQKRFTLPPHTKGMHLVTDAVLREIQEGLKSVDIGIFTLNCLHTSAGLTVCLRVTIIGLADTYR